MYESERPGCQLVVGDNGSIEHGCGRPGVKERYVCILLTKANNYFIRREHRSSSFSYDMLGTYICPVAIVGGALYPDGALYPGGALSFP